MPEKVLASARTRTSISIRRLLRYAFLGGVVGLITGICVLFVIGVFYGEAIGLAPSACLFFACTETMLLSQPVGFAGMVVGASVGVLAGAAIYYVRHHLPRT